VKRIIYYDAIKCFAIYLVIFFHGTVSDVNILNDSGAITFFNYFLQSLLSTCVPLFFMVNGALVLNKEFNLRKNIHKIIKLFILVNIWAFLLIILLKYITHDTYTWDSLLKSVWSLKLGKLNHLWFLKALISIYLLLPLIKPAYDNSDRSILYFTVAGLFLFSFGNNFIGNIVNAAQYFAGVDFLPDKFNFFPDINPFGDYFYALVYFIAGGILSKMILENKIAVRKSILVAVVILSQTILFLYGILMTIKTNAYYCVVWNGYETLMTLSMTISLFILFLGFRYKSDFINKIMFIVGKNTFGIYIVHVIFIPLLSPFFTRYPFLSNNLPANFLYAGIVLLLSLFAAVLIRKIPILSSLVKV